MARLDDLPALMPVLDDRGAGADRLDLFAPDAVFLNPAARQKLVGLELQVQQGLTLHPLRVAAAALRLDLAEAHALLTR